MAEYINKAELLHRILNDTHGDVFNAIETIETEPTIGIVHCKECYWFSSDGTFCENLLRETKADWFCADGER